MREVSRGLSFLGVRGLGSGPELLRITRRRLTGALSLGLLILPLLGRAWSRVGHPPSPSLPSWLLPLPPRGPSGLAWREAYGSWARAREAAAQEIDSLEEGDSKVSMDLRREDGLRRLMAADHTGDLWRARSAAIQAASLARTPHERFQAAMLLALIECSLGHHREELAQARVLMRLAPRDARSLAMMHRAATCNGLRPLVRQTAAALDALRSSGKGRRLDNHANQHESPSSTRT